MSSIAGTWETNSIIGAKCTIRAIPVGYDLVKSWEGFDSSEEHTIIGVYHRVTTEGYLHPTYLLGDIPGRLFKPSELCITRICSDGLPVDESHLCGEFNSGL